MSIKRELNLLPWRLYAHRQKRNQFLLVLLIMMLATFIYHQIMSSKNQQSQRQYYQLQRQQQQIEQQLAESQQQLYQLRQQANPKPLRAISVHQLEQILLTIQQFPLAQGELTQLLLHYHEQQLVLILQGKSTPQEFSGIEQLLHQQLWLQQMELTDFIPQSPQLVQFELYLHIKSEDHYAN
ncbi:hypothetical protein [Volucribacter amazonae]|uniref:Tfp pilus assembly protein PilN n=1 Tax=Volucribacter amazonae TaxID=256731 RepID=A0A9X4PR36_9PAST|nr:hypothetical protein [Volucribacter amazonae]MDG6896078.1 hypothetical protein [Volucribacter amazonae]